MRIYNVFGSIMISAENKNSVSLVTVCTTEEEAIGEFVVKVGKRFPQANVTFLDISCNDVTNIVKRRMVDWLDDQPMERKINDEKI